MAREPSPGASRAQRLGSDPDHPDRRLAGGTSGGAAGSSGSSPGARPGGLSRESCESQAFWKLGRWSYPVTASRRFDARGYGELGLEEREAELLPGEDPSRAGDAKHWVAVYAELIAALDGILANQEPGPQYGSSWEAPSLRLPTAWGEKGRPWSRTGRRGTRRRYLDAR
jgi:hypothetical protein